MRVHLEKLYTIAMEQREESRRKLEEQRMRSAEAEEELRRCEREAEECMVRVDLFSVFIDCGVGCKGGVICAHHVCSFHNLIWGVCTVLFKNWRGYWY